MIKLIIRIALMIGCPLIANAQNVGIGTTNPGTKLHIVYGPSGYSSSYFPGAVIEGNNNTYLNFLTPDGSESAILFGKASNAASGGIVYNNVFNPNGFELRTNGNNTRMVISNTGNVGIGSFSPGFPLNFASATGDKISLFGESGSHFGFGIQNSLLQIHSAASTDDIAFGYGNSSFFNETMRMKGNGIMQFTATLAKKITLYPGATGDAGFGVFGNELRIASDYNNADITFGFDNRSTTFTEKFRMRANGAFSINGNTGSPGQLMQSNGGTQSPTWTNPLNSLYNNMTEYTQVGTSTVAPLNNTNIPGLSGISIVISSRSKVVFSSSINITSNTCFGCGGSYVSVGAQIIFPGGLTQGAGSANGEIGFGVSKDCVTGMKIWTLNPGTYTINVYLRNENLSGPSITAANGRLDIIIIQE